MGLCAIDQKTGWVSAAPRARPKRVEGKVPQQHSEPRLCLPVCETARLAKPALGIATTRSGAGRVESLSEMAYFLAGLGTRTLGPSPKARPPNAKHQGNLRAASRLRADAMVTNAAKTARVVERIMGGIVARYDLADPGKRVAQKGG